MPKEKCSVRYRDLDYAVATYLELADEIMSDVLMDSEIKRKKGRCELMDRKQAKNSWKQRFDARSHKDNSKVHRTIFASKSDLKSAFRILGLSKRSWRWLIMKAQDPQTGIWMYFVDKCLPFGSSISCALFQCFSDALCHLTETRLQVKHRVTNYLDDFLFIARTLIQCNAMVRQFLDKTEWATDLIVFLGILLNGRELSLAIPLEKKDRAIELLTDMKSSKKTTVKQLQKLCGFLNFLCKVIFPGRTFVRRMYSKFSNVINVKGMAPRNAEEYKLRQHHHM